MSSLRSLSNLVTPVVFLKYFISHANILIWWEDCTLTRLKWRHEFQVVCAPGSKTRKWVWSEWCDSENKTTGHPIIIIIMCLTRWRWGPCLCCIIIIIPPRWGDGPRDDCAGKRVSNWSTKSDYTQLFGGITRNSPVLRNLRQQAGEWRRHSRRHKLSPIVSPEKLMLSGL